MRRFAIVLGALALAGLAGFWFLTMPRPLSAAQLAAVGGYEPDLANGETLFWAGGCASCHAAPDAEEADRLRLGGGQALETGYGAFGVPNISPHPRSGLGAWSFADFANAMVRGVAPDGRHYYPAFPYTSYAKMPLDDLADLWAFMKTLPAVETSGPAPETELAFPYNVRRGIGLWKRAYLSEAPVVGNAALGSDPQLLRGRYLTEGPGHCGECHTPRNWAGAMDTGRWLAGAPNPEGEGRVPNITPHAQGVAGWTEDDLAFGLESGFTPEFDSMGSTMAAVVKNFAQVGAEDRAAIAAYLKAIPALPDAP